MVLPYKGILCDSAYDRSHLTIWSVWDIFSDSVYSHTPFSLPKYDVYLFSRYNHIRDHKDIRARPNGEQQKPNKI